MTRIKQLFDLTGKVAIVTGASKGIGEAIARGLGEFGATVVVSSRKQAAVEAVAEELKKDGINAAAIECNVGHTGQCQNLIAQTAARFGRIDILVNNAGTNPYFGALEAMPMDAYQKTMDVNLRSAIELSNFAHPIMKKNGGGKIIHISSIEGYHASMNMGAYNISKAGLLMLTKNQAVEWSKDNIRVNAICPGYVATKMTKYFRENEEINKKFNKKIIMGRMANPDEMAGLAVLLASDASSYMTGESILNDGGLMQAQYM